MASARVQRWALILSAYDYNIAYKPGKQHCNADMLSRLPLETAPQDVPIPGDTIMLLETLQLQSSLRLGPIEIQHCQRFATLSREAGLIQTIPSYNPISVITWSFLFRQTVCYGEIESLFLQQDNQGYSMSCMMVTRASPA